MDIETYFTQGGPVTLEQMLLAREKRVERQQWLIEKWGKPVVSLTMVIPGPVKKSRGAEIIFNAAQEAFKDCCHQQGWTVLECEKHADLTGYEAQMAVDMEDAGMLKRELLTLEENHALGRLWDFDVLGNDGSVSRGDLGLPPRRCLVCGDMAHACARAKKHTLEELYGAMEFIIKSL